MEGNGPRNGDPRPMSVLLFSTDPVALDATASRMVDLDPTLVPTTKWGQEWDLGRYSSVEILGDPLETFFAPDFVVRRTPPRLAPAGERSILARAFKNWITPRPALIPANCTTCGTCVQVCPVNPKAIDFRDGRRSPPVYDYERCIRCYCCQEMCPDNAITIETPLLGRLLHR
jgi:ferredoxin